MSKPPKVAQRARRRMTADELGRLAFENFWNAKATPEDQRIVLDTLAQWCGWNRAPFNAGDDKQQNFNLGAQSIFLQMQKAAGVTSPFGRMAGEHIEEGGDLREGEHRLTGGNDG